MQSIEYDLGDDLETIKDELFKATTKRFKQKYSSKYPSKWVIIQSPRLLKYSNVQDILEEQYEQDRNRPAVSFVRT